MMAASEWIAFLDSDDTWHPDKIAKQVSLHKKNPKLKISYTDEQWVRDDKKIALPKKYQKPLQSTFENSLAYCNIAPSSVVIKKELLDKIGGFDESLKVCEDYDLWLRILTDNEIGYIPEKLMTKYGGHDDQLSQKHWGMDRFRVIALEKHIDGEFDDIVRRELLKKYELLSRGAVKYNRLDDVEIYRVRMEQLRSGY